MGNMKDLLKKSLQLLDEVTEIPLKQNTNTQKDGQHVFLQQSVTLLAFKDKLSINSTATPGASPKLLFGIIKEDLPLFIGAIIGASLVIALCVLILIFWKCCCRMTILSKKKEYWLQPKNTSNLKGKKYPTVQSSVVFLGLKPTQDFAYKREKSSEDCTVFNFFANSSDKDLLNSTFDDSMSYTMSSQCPDIIVSDEKKPDSNGPNLLPNGTCSNDTANQSCSVISTSSVLQNGSITHCTNSSILSPNDMSIPSITIHQESPALFHRSFYSGNFDQHSLYSCDSHPASEIGVRKCSSFTWSNYSLRPSSSDCYYDLFQKANFCKKRKNRMRSDIAAAIALNRSQSSQLNKDTELLVENEVEVVLAERTTL
ncbi:uncharacterized protein [Parasteatoda tepidariorum]|uniref:uncharacterized protein isoform X2 n=1 Tax=Parasteatoda tepidariorum TaxID=114398 RepID=UPI00077FAECA|nr:uncharacterized protein LOC107438211 isoform X2 [Parasteatoda tepidariorum]